MTIIRISVLSLFLCILSPGFSGAQNNHYRVLFVGNSLTYSNDLPALVEEIALLDRVELTYKTFTFPDYSLEDHWKEGRVGEEIEKEMQGPPCLWSGHQRQGYLILTG